MKTKKFANKFIKNLCQNVDKAFAYVPDQMDRPLFRFNALGSSG
jgi:hypothetical protein